jgi:hypothetical protein
MRLPRRLQRTVDEREEWMTLAAAYAARLTETGSRCHLNDGTSRFCHWQATELPRKDAEGRSLVGVRCTIHPGGRHLDSRARLDPGDFAPTRD